jgi:alginate O-acetyltransferase complex protein AlgI
MVFNSLQFLVFFMVVTISYFQLKNQKARIWLLLLASCYFYMTFIPLYILILAFTIIIDYFAGILISRATGTKKLWLTISIIANVGILVFYKYFNFFLGAVEPIIGQLVPHYQLPYMNIILPIGLSFHTFQAMSYTIEVYRGKQPPERNFIIYALYVMYYPQLVAGPIERPQNMLHQFHEYRPYNWNNVKEGLARMAWGFFKKVVIADRVSIAVDYVFSNHQALGAYPLLVGAMFYSFQIYCDFSGYSDIALGASKIMGIQLMENFNEPYKAKNITEFWTRWHISLSTWFRDYLYIPLGGNRLGERRRKVNAFIVFLLSGLWHGANWTFVAWGSIHGALVTLLPGRKKAGVEKSTVTRALFIVVNFILVTICWVFFRASNVQVALHYIASIVTLKAGATKFGLNTAELLTSVIFIAIMLFRENKFRGHFIKSDKAFGIYLSAMVLVCYLFGVFGENQFIYFQF